MIEADLVGRGTYEQRHQEPKRQSQETLKF